MEKLIKKFFYSRIKRLGKKEDEDFLKYLEDDSPIDSEERLKALYKLKELLTDDLKFKFNLRWQVIFKLVSISIEYLERQKWGSK